MRMYYNIVPPMEENTFFIIDTDTNEGVLIDPGGDASKLIKYVEINNISIKAILLTHSHGDHMSAIPEIRKKYDWPIYIHKDDAYILKNPKENFSTMLGYNPISLEPDYTFKDDGEIFTFGKRGVFTIMHTPGHTPGSVCFYSPEEKAIFSGDTLFYSSYGRMDFPPEATKEVVKKIQEYTGQGNLPGEDMNVQIKTIENKLLVLPSETKVFPGHGLFTSIAIENKMNPFGQKV